MRFLSFRRAVLTFFIVVPVLAVLSICTDIGALRVFRIASAQSERNSVETKRSIRDQSIAVSRERPSAMTMADFDADGAQDVAIGSDTKIGTGVIDIRRGSPDAFAPTDESVFGRVQMGYNPNPLLADVRTITVPEAADLIIAGNFDADSNKDLIAARKGGERLFLYRGDGLGGFAYLEEIDLPGSITALTSGEFRAADGKDDVAVGIGGSSGTVLLIFDGAEGGVFAEPMETAIDGTARSLRFASMDHDPFVDLVIASDDQVLIAHGWGRKTESVLSTRLELVSTVPGLRSISVGHFVWDREGRLEIAAQNDSGIEVLGANGLRTDAFPTEEQATRTRGTFVRQAEGAFELESYPESSVGESSGWSVVKAIRSAGSKTAGGADALLATTNLFYRETDDILLADGSGIEIVRQVNNQVAPPRLPIGRSIEASSEIESFQVAESGRTPAAVLQLPQKINGVRTLVVLYPDDFEPSVIELAPTNITVDRTDDPSGAGLTAASVCGAGASDCSLRGAIEFANIAANSPATVNLQANTYILSINGTTAAGCSLNSNGDLGVNRSTTILGAGAATTIIRQTGNGPASDGDRIMCMNETFLTNLTYTFSGVTFVGGRDGTAAGTGTALGGGGIIGGELDNSLTLTNVVMANNQVTVLGSANIGGGGIQITGGSLTITNSTFGGTSAPGLYTDRASTITGNLQGGSGGGVMYTPSSPQHSGGTGTLTVTGSTFSRNNAGSTSSGGGGLNTVTFAFASPGGIGSGSASVSTSTFSNNQATTGTGGGLFAESLATSVATASFTNNSAGNSGGAIGGGGQTLTLNGTNPSITMTGNTAPRGSSVASSGPVLVTGTNTTLSGSILVHSNGVWTNSAGSVLAPTDIVLEGGALVMNNSIMNVAGNISIGPTQNNLIPGGFNGGSGTMNLGGNLTFNNTAGTSFTGGTGTINFNGNTAQSITNNASITFFNLTDSNVTQPLVANNSFAVNGSLNVNGANAIFDPVAAAVISGTGTLTGSGTARVRRTAATADFSTQYSITNKTLTNLTVEYIGASAQVLSPITFGPLKINNGSGVNLSGTSTVGGLLTLTSGALGVGSQTLVINNGTSVGTGSITSNANGTVNYNQGGNGQNVLAFNYGNLTFSNFNKVLAPTGTIGIAGSFTPGTAASHTTAGSTVNFNGTAAQTIPAFNFNNLTISGARTTNSVTLVNGGTIGVAGTFSPTATFTSGNYISTNNTIDFNSGGSQTIPAFNYFNLTSSSGGGRTFANSGVVGIAGVWTQGASAYTATGSTINFNGTGAQTVNAFNYNNLTISGARGANNVTLPNSGTIGVAGVFNPVAAFAGGAYVVTGSTIVFNGGSLQSIPAFTFNNLTLNNGAGGNLGGNVTVGGTMTLQAGNLGVGGNTLTLNGAATASGGTFSSAANGTVNYNQSTNGQVVLPGNYGNLTFSNFNKDLTNSTVGIAGIFTPGTAVGHTITGSTFIYNGTSPQTLPSGFATYNNLTLNNAAGVTGFGGLTVQGLLRVQAGAFTSSSNYNNVQIDSGATLAGVAATTINVTGDWTNNGTFTANGNTVNFNGTSAQTIGGAGTTFNNLTVNNPPAGVSMTSNVSVNGTLTLTGGTLFVGASTLTINAGTSAAGGLLASGAIGTVIYNQSTNGQPVLPGSYGNLTFSNFNKILPSTGTVGVAGNFVPGTATGHTITGSTFDFNGTGAQTIPAFNYNNLTSSNTGARTLSGTGTIGIAAAFTPGSNSYTVSGSTVELNGAGAQTIPAFTYQNLSTAGAGTKSLGGNASAQGALTIGAGTILDCGGFNLTVAGEWTNNGSFVCGSGTVIFNGAAPQTIAGSAQTDFNGLTIDNAAGLTFNFNTSVNNLTLTSGNVDMGSNTMTVGSAGSISRTSGHIIGNVAKVFSSPGSFTFEVGTATGHTSAIVNVTALAINPSTLTIKANDGTAPSTPPRNDAQTLDRYWDVTESGDLMADITFNYLDADVDGTEANYRVIKIEGGGAAQPQMIDPGCPGSGAFCVDPAANTIHLRGATSFSTWTAGEVIATAAPAEVSGRVVDTNGRGVYGATVQMTGTAGNVLTARSNSFGYFILFGVPTGRSYFVTVKHRRYSFDSQAITVQDNFAGLNFVAEPPQ